MLCRINHSRNRNFCPDILTLTPKPPSKGFSLFSNTRFASPFVVNCEKILLKPSLTISKFFIKRSFFLFSISSIILTTSSFSPTKKLNLIYGIYMILGVVSTLLYFRQSKFLSNKTLDETKFAIILNYLGRFFIGTTLGSIFAGVIISSTIALIERINFLINFIYNLIVG